VGEGRTPIQIVKCGWDLNPQSGGDVTRISPFSCFLVIINEALNTKFFDNKAREHVSCFEALG
jgi:hypothetical protein